MGRVSGRGRSEWEGREQMEEGGRKEGRKGGMQGRKEVWNGTRIDPGLL